MRHLMSALSILVLALVLGCGPTSSQPAAPKPHAPGGSDGSDAGAGTPAVPGCDPADPDANADQDGDGYSIAQGDCDDCNPTVNPGAIQVPGDATDYACNGMPGVVAACDGALAGLRDAASLAKALDQCDPRFFLSAMLVGPSDARARKVVPRFGVLQPRGGQAMALLSNGIAADKSDADFDANVEEDPGTELSVSNSYANPLPALVGAAGCSQSQPATVNDYTELVVKLKAPSNANSFSFDFQFFSAEYPVWVCTEFNDEFLVEMESPGEFTTATNITFDSKMNPITINNGLFTVCTNSTTQYTMNCKSPVTDIAGTGYEDTSSGLLGGKDPIGGSTGWLTTTAPVTPNEEVTLHFIIFDEGDHIYDSAVLIDNFQWSVVAAMAPMTIN